VFRAVTESISIEPAEDQTATQNHFTRMCSGLFILTGLDSASHLQTRGVGYTACQCDFDLLSLKHLVIAKEQNGHG
jgi:hypothetical protein